MVQFLLPLAQAVLQFIETPKLVEQMAEQSRVLAETLYDVRSVNKIIMDAMGITTVTNS